MLQINELESFLSSSKRKETHIFYPTAQNKTDDLFNIALNKKCETVSSKDDHYVSKNTPGASHLVNIKIENRIDKLLNNSVKMSKTSRCFTAKISNTASHLEYPNITDAALINSFTPKYIESSKIKAETFLQYPNENFTNFNICEVEFTIDDISGTQDDIQSKVNVLDDGIKKYVLNILNKIHDERQYGTLCSIPPNTYSLHTDEGNDNNTELKNILRNLYEPFGNVGFRDEFRLMNKLLECISYYVIKDKLIKPDIKHKFWGVAKMKIRTTTSYFSLETTRPITQTPPPPSYGDGEYYIVPDYSDMESKHKFYLVSDAEDEEDAFSKVYDISGENRLTSVVLDTNNKEFNLVEPNKKWLDNEEFSVRDFYFTEDNKYKLNINPSSWMLVKVYFLNENKSFDKSVLVDVLNNYMQKYCDEKDSTGTANNNETTPDPGSLRDGAIAYVKSLCCATMPRTEEMWQRKLYDYFSKSSYEEDVYSSFKKLIAEKVPDILTNIIANRYFNEAASKNVWDTDRVSRLQEVKKIVFNEIDVRFYGNIITDWEKFENCGSIDLSGNVQDLLGDISGEESIVKVFICAIGEARKVLKDWKTEWLRGDDIYLPPLYTLIKQTDGPFEKFKRSYAEAQRKINDLILEAAKINHEAEVGTAREFIENKLNSLWGELEYHPVRVETSWGTPNCEQQTTLPPVNVKLRTTKFIDGKEIKSLEENHNDTDYDNCGSVKEIRISEEELPGKWEIEFNPALPEYVGNLCCGSGPTNEIKNNNPSLTFPPVALDKFNVLRGTRMERINNSGKWAFFPVNLNNLKLNHIWNDISGENGVDHYNLWEGVIRDKNFFKDELDKINHDAIVEAQRIDATYEGNDRRSWIIREDIYKKLISEEFFGKVVKLAEDILDYYKTNSPIIREKANSFLDDTVDTIITQVTFTFQKGSIIRDLVIDNIKEMANISKETYNKWITGLNEIKNNQSSSFPPVIIDKKQDWNKPYENLIELGIEMIKNGRSEYVIRTKLEEILKKPFQIGNIVETQYNAAILGLSCYLYNEEPYEYELTNTVSEQGINGSMYERDIVSGMVDCSGGGNRRIISSKIIDYGSLRQKENFTNKRGDIYEYGSINYDGLEYVQGLRVNELKEKAFNEGLAVLFAGDISGEDINQKIDQKIGNIISELVASNPSIINTIKTHNTNFSVLKRIIGDAKKETIEVKDKYSTYQDNVNYINNELSEINDMIRDVNKYDYELDKIQNLKPSNKMRKIRLGYHIQYYTNALETIDDISGKYLDIEVIKQNNDVIRRELEQIKENVETIKNEDCGSITGSGLLEERQKHCNEEIQAILDEIPEIPESFTVNKRQAKLDDLRASVKDKKEKLENDYQEFLQISPPESEPRLKSRKNDRRRAYISSDNMAILLLIVFCIAIPLIFYILRRLFSMVL